MAQKIPAKAAFLNPKSPTIIASAGLHTLAELRQDGQTRHTYIAAVTMNGIELLCPMSISCTTDHDLNSFKIEGKYFDSNKRAYIAGFRVKADGKETNPLCIAFDDKGRAVVLEPMSCTVSGFIENFQKSAFVSWLSFAVCRYMFQGVREAATIFKNS